MPWLVFVLLVANIALGGYLIATDPSEDSAAEDVRTLEVNADKVTVVPPSQLGEARPPEAASPLPQRPDDTPASGSDSVAAPGEGPPSVSDGATIAAPDPEPQPAPDATTPKPASDSAMPAPPAPKPAAESASPATPAATPPPALPSAKPAPELADPAAAAPKSEPAPAAPAPKSVPDFSTDATPAQRPAADPSAAPTPQPTAPQPVPEGAPGARAGAPACLEWGSFGVAELERARVQLAALGVGRTVVREAGYEPAWWVHVPPLPSRAEAQRLAREIQAAGVSDVHVVGDGERWRNAISLGIYKSQEAANTRLARLREARVANATVTQRNDLLRLNAIVVVAPAADVAMRIGDLRAAYPATELREVPCPAEVP